MRPCGAVVLFPRVRRGQSRPDPSCTAVLNFSLKAVLNFKLKSLNFKLKFLCFGRSSVLAVLGCVSAVLNFKLKFSTTSVFGFRG